MSNNEELSKKVYNYLFEQIFTGSLKPGDRIVESRIASIFNASRTPIREALRQLEGQGLVVIYPNRFTEVIAFSDKQIKDIGVVRIALDVLSIKLATLYASKAELLDLKKIADQCIQAKKNNDDYLSRELDVQFHQQLCYISKNELLYKQQQDLSLKVQFILLNYNVYNVSGEDHLEEHSKIVDALLQGDCDTALKVCIHHLVDFYGISIDNPEAFFLH